MTVANLIQELQKCDPNIEVVVTPIEDGYKVIRGIADVRQITPTCLHDEDVSTVVEIDLFH